MSSVGQVAGGVIGGAIGFFFGNPILGAQIGLMVGGYIDPPPGPHSEGPRLDNLTVQTATYGAGKTRAYGTVSLTGNVFWLEGDKYAEHQRDQASGGKGGGGGATATTYTYSATFAVALTEGQEIAGVRRLWVGDRLIYDAGSDNTESIVASNADNNWRLYTGADDQEPEPRMQADKGVANVSSYPGRAYIVFYDLDLTEHYGNSLLAAQVVAEVVCSGTRVQESHFEAATVDTSLNRIASAEVTRNTVSYLLINHDGLNNIVGASIREHRVFEYDQLISTINVTINDGYGYTAPQMAPCHQCAPGDLRAYAPISYYLSGPNRTALCEISAAGAVTGSQYNDGTWKYGGQYVFASNGATAYAACTSSAQSLMAFGACEMISSSSSTVKASSIGYSENYVYVIDAALSSASSCTVHKFDLDLVFIGTLTLSVPGEYGVLKVVADDDFMVYSGTEVSRYVNGTAKILSTAMPNAGLLARSWFDFSLNNEPYGISVAYVPGSGGHDVHVVHSTMPSAWAKLRDIVTAECGRAGLSAADLDLASLTNSDVRGYRLTGVSSPRAALEPLQAAWPFDVYQKGYKVGFKTRGGASVATIAESDLGAVSAGESPAIMLPIQREMETQIARTVTVKHLDADRDYDLGEQTAPERPGVSSVEPRQVDLPIVLTANEAAQMADVLNAKEWCERVRFGPFSLPPTHANLEPADVVTINHRNRAWEVRLTRVEYLPDGRLTCDAVLTSSAAYTSTAVGSNPLVAGQDMVLLRGVSRVVLLDIPRIRAEQDNFGLTAGMYGFTAGWPGGVLVRSDDAGQTWQAVQGFDTKAHAFTVAETTSAAGSYGIDHATVLTLTPIHATATLYSITEDQLYAHGNLAAWGADGRWEIVAIKTVTDNTGTYTVKDMLRGLYGTEWASGLHVAGDMLILLTTAAARFVGLPTTAINSERLWRAVTHGDPVSSASNIADVYEGHNLKPLAAVDINGSRDMTTHDWLITWARRSRWPVEVFSGVAVPLGETSEAYEVDIYDASYATKKRTISGLTSASAPYPSAQQIADHGSEQGTLYLDVYQLSAAVGRGERARFSITRPLSVDDYAANVVLLMHMDGANNSTTFTDVKGHTATANGTAKITTARYLAGNSSAVFDKTSGCYVSLAASSDWDVGAGNFTLEFFLYVNSYNTNGSRLFQTANGDVVTGLYITLTSSGQLNVASSSNGSSFNLFSASVGSVATGAWKHIAYVRNGNSWDVYIEGVKYNLATVSGTVYFNAAATPVIGGQSGTNRCLDGNIEDLRLTKAARYTAAFTPPVVPFPDP